MLGNGTHPEDVERDVREGADHVDVEGYFGGGHLGCLCLGRVEGRGVRRDLSTCE